MRIVLAAQQDADQYVVETFDQKALHSKQVFRVSLAKNESELVPNAQLNVEGIPSGQGAIENHQSAWKYEMGVRCRKGRLDQSPTEGAEVHLFNELVL